MYRAHASWGLLPDQQNEPDSRTKRGLCGTDFLAHSPTVMEQQAGDNIIAYLLSSKTSTA